MVYLGLCTICEPGRNGERACLTIDLTKAAYIHAMPCWDAKKGAFGAIPYITDPMFHPLYCNQVEKRERRRNLSHSSPSVSPNALSNRDEQRRTLGERLAPAPNPG